jgi:hypothetical protein
VGVTDGVTSTPCCMEVGLLIWPVKWVMVPPFQLPVPQGALGNVVVLLSRTIQDCSGAQ